MIVPVERRQKYMEALEKASVEGKIEAFVRFIGRLLNMILLNEEKMYFCSDSLIIKEDNIYNGFKR